MMSNNQLNQINQLCQLSLRPLVKTGAAQRRTGSKAQAQILSKSGRPPQFGGRLVSIAAASKAAAAKRGEQPNRREAGCKGGRGQCSLPASAFGGAIYFSAAASGAAGALAAAAAPACYVAELRQPAALAARAHRARDRGGGRTSGLRIVWRFFHAANQRPPNAAYLHRQKISHLFLCPLQKTLACATA